MKQHNIVDLTSLLDVILIILFAVLLNMNQSAESAQASSTDKSSVITDLELQITSLEDKLEDSITITQELTESITSLESDFASKESNFNNITTQYKQIFKQMSEILGEDSETIENIANKQDLSEEEQESLLSSITDTNILMENLHKYETIANTFAFIDITFDLNTEALIYNGQTSYITITEEDGINDHLFQLKRNEITTYFATNLESQEISQSFILMTIKFDPYNTKRFYVTLVTEAIDLLRESYQDKVIFDTIYLTN